MFVRAVRFSDVTAERVDALVARIEEGGPPPGARISKLQLVFDQAQGTAVVLQHFRTAEDLQAGAETLPRWIRRRHPAPAFRWTRERSR